MAKGKAVELSGWKLKPQLDPPFSSALRGQSAMHPGG